jgi:hypothetical protein
VLSSTVKHHMLATSKFLLGAGTASAVVVAAFSLYLWLALPSCTLLPPSEVASPDGRVTAVVESRTCSKPKNDWAMVTLRASGRDDVPMVFRLLEASGPIAVRWAGTSRLEIRYPSGAKTWQTTQPSGWPALQFVATSDL